MAKALEEEKKVRIFSAAGTELKDVPDWVTIFKAGINRFVWDDDSELVVDVTQSVADRVIERFKSIGNPMLVDWEHQSEGPDKAPAAGFIHELKFDADKGLLGRVEWTAEGRSDIERGRFRFHSAVFCTDEDGQLERLLSLTLTNRAAQTHVVPIAASARRFLTQGATTMEPLGMIAKWLGLEGPFATPEDMMVAIKEKIDELTGAESEEAPPEMVEEMKAATAKVKAASDALTKIGKVVKASDDAEPDAIANAVEKFAASSKPNPDEFVPAAEFKQVQDDLEKLQAESLTRQKAEFIDGGMNDGKITASNRAIFEDLWDADPDNARKRLESAPKLVSTSRISSNGSGNDPAKPRESDPILANADNFDEGGMDQYKRVTDYMKKEKVTYVEALEAVGG